MLQCETRREGSPRTYIIGYAQYNYTKSTMGAGVVSLHSSAQEGAQDDRTDSPSTRLAKATPRDA